MKLITLILVALMATAAFAATSTEIEYNGQGMPTFQALMSKPLSHGFGTFINVNASENWSQAYAGLTYAPIPNIQVGYGKGFESVGTHERTGAFIWSGYGRVSGCLAVEDGASGPWHRLTVDYRLSPKITVGWVDKAYAGSGPTVTYTLTKDVRVKVSSYDGDISTMLMLAF